MEFEAEVKQVKSRKSASLDVVYTVTFETNNPKVLQLGMLSGDSWVNVKVEADDA